MAMTRLTINDREYEVDVAEDIPLLWVLRDFVGLTGTKYGCGEGMCGSCTVHVDGKATRSCVTPLSEAVGKRITTIEGLSPDGDHPLQRAWLQENVTQCGYCQPGQIMTAAALLAEIPDPSDDEIDAAMSDVLCRCGTYQRIRRAIHRAGKEA
jgi:aerobic-type carbon monoxide dehydrogenase small subunit (CoxS/CutS family)